jgi:hypothetical protein
MNLGQYACWQILMGKKKQSSNCGPACLFRFEEIGQN